MNPHVFALSEDMTVGEAITALQSNRDVEMVFYLYVVDERRHLVGVVVAAPAAARVAGDAAQADHDGRPDQRARGHGSGGSRASGRVLQPARHSRRRRREQARRRHHGGRRHRRHQGRGDRRHLSAGRRRGRRARVHAAGANRCASGCRGSASISPTAFLAASVVALFEGTIEQVAGWRCSCRSSRAWAATPRRRP